MPAGRRMNRPHQEHACVWNPGLSNGGYGEVSIRRPLAYMATEKS
ncbi:hypothetical protein PpBr36_08962 [Pyricularia pennisetigena]|nr:hypothetical protein PpBr36_08962 [Pyricularia pennisetigena]TLS24419.1 hypothetical protein PpBr36_08962 [Pyricularia pennisetigena]